MTRQHEDKQLFRTFDEFEDNTEPTKNLPERVYLQCNPNNVPGTDFNDMTEITWCVDKINESDVEYVKHSGKALTEEEKLDFVHEVDKLHYEDDKRAFLSKYEIREIIKNK